MTHLFIRCLARLGQPDVVGFVAEGTTETNREIRRHRRQVAAIRAVAAVELAAGFRAAHHQDAQWSSPCPHPAQLAPLQRHHINAKAGITSGRIPTMRQLMEAGTGVFDRDQVFRRLREKPDIFHSCVRRAAFIPWVVQNGHIHCRPPDLEWQPLVTAGDSPNPLRAWGHRCAKSVV